MNKKFTIYYYTCILKHYSVRACNAFIKFPLCSLRHLSAADFDISSSLIWNRNRCYSVILKSNVTKTYNQFDFVFLYNNLSKFLIPMKYSISSVKFKNPSESIPYNFAFASFVLVISLSMFEKACTKHVNQINMSAFKLPSTLTWPNSAVFSFSST